MTNDLNSCIYLLTEGSSKNGDKVTVNQGIEEMENKISHYPSDKRIFLMNGCRLFVKYSTTDTKELLEAAKIYYNSGVYNVIWSDSTLKYKNELLTKYKQVEVINTFDSVMKAQEEQMKTSPVADTVEANKMSENFRKQLELHVVESKSLMEQIFKRIFNENI